MKNIANLLMAISCLLDLKTGADSGNLSLLQKLDNLGEN